MPDMVSVIIRGVVTFIILLTMTRILGKRQLSQLTFLDYVVGITIGSMAATGTIELENAPMTSLVGMLVWTILPISVAYGAMKSEIIRNLIYGKPTAIIEDGELMENNLRKGFLSTDDLMTMLRQKDTFNLSEVEDVFLETNGQVSILKRSEQQPVTSGQMGFKTAGQEKPAIVIQDGSVNKSTLQSLKINRKELDNMLYEQGIEHVSDVMLAQLDSGGSLYVDLYDDWRVEPHRPHTAKILHANLLKFQAQMETFTLDTENPQAQALYRELAEQTEDMIENLRGYLSQ